MKKSRIISLVLASALLAGVLAACTPTPPPAQPAQPAPAATGQAAPTEQVPAAQATSEAPLRGLRLATGTEPGAIAPARHGALIPAFMNELTHSYLFRVDTETLEPVPDMVESWTAISDTLFEFTILPGIMFHNGEEVTAYDVVASLFYVQNYPYSRAQHASIYNAEVVDRYTLRIDTGTPNAMLLNDLAHQANATMPRSLIDAGHDFTADPVGNGPFIFDEWSSGDFLNFVRFDNYFNQERMPQLAYTHWRIIPEGASRTIALEAGEIDFIIDVPFPDIARLEANPDIEVHMITGTAFNFLIVNNDLPYFDNRYVRMAIDMAIDKEAAVLASVDGFGIPLWQNTPPVFLGSSAVGARHFDPDYARELLAREGVDPANINMEILASSEEARRRGEVIQANLADIGITVTIAMVDHATYLNLTQFGNYEAGLGNFIAFNLIQFLRATSHIDFIDAQNRGRIYNQELSDLIDLAIATIDTDARTAVLEEASRVANEHVGKIPMHQAILARAFNSDFVLPELSAAGFMSLNVAYWAE
ncbi:MAG: ABC transporter substrate-binding protein [Defluviitaleaceae bacterium]|nr:ABC transporter substrate-binding protein [Defluviitaleaceae bacterium]